ncbi:carbohydrate ABC transporter permease [Oceanobacillus aidingensis]|uniref:Carbohydrate ABC transporter permease n=1 Tax=Oceanobacillus aidingensis TaxID=645964 RepID=A0ABV9JSH6_9BACI
MKKEIKQQVNKIGYRNKKNRAMKWTSYLFVLPSAIFTLVFLVFPILYNIFLSFKNVTMMNLRSGSEFIGIDNYLKIINDPLFYTSLKNSIIFTIACMLFQFVIGFALALFLNKDFPGRNLFRSMLLLGWMIPIVITGTIYKWMLAGDTGVFNFIMEYLGIIDSPIYWLTDENMALVGTIIANIWIGIPFNMLILLAGLQGLPTQLYEAAKIDGASRFKQFIFITLPLMKPTIQILLMLTMIYTFKVFDLIFVMTGGGPVDATTIFPLYAYQEAFTNYDLSVGAAISSVMFVLLTIFALVYLYISRKEDKN